ncbi:Yip1 family protein [Anaerocellum danielii]|uniref:Yip1 family protein n=1 Tax=Anaerocellum danielii TaxID=1387557 RepID=A0ABZ0U088_9FIRM|nr:Yip1 family protein [Caldicellulosiruptor danielii]WPX08716.1 Yip1 family protein [Caldicellulosiruptor danielii]
MEYLKPSNLLNLIISPTKVFQKIKEKPDFLVLLIFIPLIAGLSMLFLPKISDEAILEYIKKITEDPQVQEATLKTLKFTKSPIYLAGTTFLHYLISFLIASFVLLIIVRLAGGEIDYRRSLTIVAVANLVMIPYFIFYVIYVRSTNLNMLDVKMDFKYFVSTYLNVFAIWRYVLIGIGVFAVCELSKLKSAIVTLIYSVVTLIMPIISIVVNNFTKFRGS